MRWTAREYNKTAAAEKEQQESECVSEVGWRGQKTYVHRTALLAFLWNPWNGNQVSSFWCWDTEQMRFTWRSNAAFLLLIYEPSFLKFCLFLINWILHWKEDQLCHLMRKLERLCLFAHLSFAGKLLMHIRQRSFSSKDRGRKQTVTGTPQPFAVYIYVW